MIAGQPGHRKPPFPLDGRLADSRRLLAKSGEFPEDGRVTAVPPCTAASTPSLHALTDQCVQCALCLPACPTYALDAIEAESPRGRIALAKAWDIGLLAPTGAGDHHLDHCLGCRRCETVCPAGVAYDTILTMARTRQRRRRKPPGRQRIIEWLSAHPSTLTALLSAYRTSWSLLPQNLRPLPRPPATLRAATCTETDARPMSLFVGCVARSYEQPLHQAVCRLGAVLGLDITIPASQTCCGSLHAHAGEADRAAALAAKNRQAFSGASTVLSLASGCHDTLAESLRGQAHVRDAIDVIAEGADWLEFAVRPERIALHLPCTQRNAVRSDSALLALLARVPELDVVVIDAGLGCCGAAGTQMLTDSERAARFRKPLLDQLAASGATRLLSANIGCRLHLGNGTTLPVQHPLEFLAECLA
jgi:glycolate oxidase iron-sulfur subunit